MALYPPDPIFSDADKRLLALLSKLITDSPREIGYGSNYEVNSITLSDDEADELVSRLEDLLDSAHFKEAALFTEIISNPANNEEAREIYLSNRSERGRLRVMASAHWADFQIRLGLRPRTPFRPTTETMPLPYFNKMERKLLRATGLSPRVADLVMRTIEAQSDRIEELRRGRNHLKMGIVKEAIRKPMERLRNMPNYVAHRQLSTTQIASAITIIADMSVIFTTRDWGVAGTISTMAGALATTVSE